MHDAPLDLAGHAAYLQALRRQLEASTGQPVECLQTHISSLLLTHGTRLQVQEAAAAAVRRLQHRAAA
ncbi:hypothetical protein [Rhizobacter sp. J219]|uniref:hypothetical protein n=1 Tax=Rhizobacter sp. J219 TaxID=2898430 RepID=UPI0027E2A894|nr:hypothetical protein [Rhizobacter sp. J219]